MEPHSHPVTSALPHERPAALAALKCSDRNLPLVEFLACVLEGRAGLYVSTPITTGPRYLQWLRRGGGWQDNRKAALQREVIEPNLARGRELVHRVRDRFRGVVVIDPTAVRLPGWEQGEYHELWGHIIERYARTVVFGDGWEYSHGCAFEFLTAHRARAVALDEQYSTITVEEGLRRIRNAVADYQAVGLSPSLLIAAVDELASLSSPEVTP